MQSVCLSGFAQRTRICLKLKNIPFELTELDLTKPMPEGFLALNPLGQVPVIQHRGIVLNESSIINDYLEDVFPTPAVFPSTPYKKAISRILIDYCNHEFVPHLYRLLMNQAREKDAELTESALKTWRWVDEQLVRHNPEGSYFFDEEGFGIAELSYAPFFQRYCLNAYYRYFVIPE